MLVQFSDGKFKNRDGTDRQAKEYIIQHFGTLYTTYFIEKRKKIQKNRKLIYIIHQLDNTEPLLVKLSFG